MKKQKEILEKLESEFNVIYPNNKNATYSTILNYSDDLDKPLQRWYRYKEGFSIDLVKKLIAEFSKGRTGIIFDPFLGSGSTIIAANECGNIGLGCETNPFSYFLSQVKLTMYSKNDIQQFKNEYENILKNELLNDIDYSLPNLSISEKVFDKEIEKYYMGVKECIKNVRNIKVRNLLLLGWLSILESISNYRKAGNGLKIKRYVNPKIICINDVRDRLLNQYNLMYEDLLKTKTELKNQIYNDSCLNAIRRIKNDSIMGIIFSPPYANCFDYTEIYKLELWFGDFISSYEELKKLRNNAISSNLNGNLDDVLLHDLEPINDLIDELDVDRLWDKRIVKMLRHYYDDLFKLIDDSYRVLEKDGFMNIVIGNSAYGGIVFPSDLIVANYAKKIGFYVEKIEVYRYIVTSSQQYEKTKNVKKYLRESVVCLVKK